MRRTAITRCARARQQGREREKRRKKNAKRAAEFRAAASSSVTVAARILLDIPRAVRMRSSECRARKPRRMAPRVWVVRKGQGPRGCRATRAVRRGIRRNEQEERDGERMRRCVHVCVCTCMRKRERDGRIVENLPTAAAAMPPNRVRAILINRRRPGR